VGCRLDVLGSLADFTVTIPKLPAEVSIQSISVTQQGLQITASGQNTTSASSRVMSPNFFSHHGLRPSDLLST